MPCSTLSTVSHDIRMPSVRFEVPGKIWCHLIIVGSETCVQRRHDTDLIPLIDVERPKWSTCRLPWVINKIPFTDDGITFGVAVNGYVLVKVFPLGNQAPLGGVRYHIIDVAVFVFLGHKGKQLSNSGAFPRRELAPVVGLEPDLLTEQLLHHALFALLPRIDLRLLRGDDRIDGGQEVGDFALLGERRDGERVGRIFICVNSRLARPHRSCLNPFPVSISKRLGINEIIV